MPPQYAAVDPCEPSASQTECLLECPADAEFDIGLRFLHLQRRTAERIDPATGEATGSGAPEAGGAGHGSWDEAVEREQHLTGRVAGLLGSGAELLFHIPPEETEEPGGPEGRLLRHCTALAGAIVARAERTAGPYGALRLSVRAENRTQPPAPLRTRDDGLACALIAAHLLIAVPGGRFLSMTDPPEWAAPEVAACENIGTWPVLAGPAECHDLMLSSPVILYDHPEVAPESAGDLFDATEIDEILTLRTLALTDVERQEARATDQRAADLLDRLDGLPPEMLERMHGAIRYLSPGPGSPDSLPPASTEPVMFTEPGTFAGPGTPAEPGTSAEPGAPAGPGTFAGPGTGPSARPWWDPGADTSVSPQTDHVLVAGVRVARGSRVLMRPGARRADAQDIFLAGREAMVEAVLHDVDGQIHVAVSPVSDPLADLQRGHGRFLYFAPDEIEPVDAPGAGGGGDDGEHGKEETR
jgi:hypothetical protein